MDHFAGPDVSVKETSVCIVDETGKVVREVKVASEPEALLSVLKNPAYRFKRIGLEAGPLSQWLFGALAEAELPVVCVETRHMQAVLKAQINKTDRNDARGIAQMMGGALPSGACEDVTQSETANAADPSPPRAPIGKSATVCDFVLCLARQKYVSAFAGDTAVRISARRVRAGCRPRPSRKRP
jgi:Transposase